MIKRQLSQEENDKFFEAADGENQKQAVVAFDFSRLDRIPKSQLSAILSLHETFLRNLIARLSIYLRVDVTGDLISIEQPSYSEFIGGLIVPSCVVALGMKPYDWHSLIEVNHSLLSTVIDLVLGGKGKLNTDLNREVTEIEENVLEGFFRLIARELREAWKPIAPIDFDIESIQTKRQLSERAVGNDALVIISMDLRVAESIGIVRLALPALALTVLRKQFESQRDATPARSQETEVRLRQRLGDELQLNVECVLLGSTIRLKDLTTLAPGNVIDTGLRLDEPATILVNGAPKLRGDIVAGENRKLGFAVRELSSEAASV